MSKLHEQSARAQSAKSLLENRLFNEAFDKIEAHLIDTWKTSKIGQDEERHNAWLSIALLHNLKDQFTQLVNTGVFAEKELLRIQKESKVEQLRKKIRG